MHLFYQLGLYFTTGLAISISTIAPALKSDLEREYKNDSLSGNQNSVLPDNHFTKRMPVFEHKRNATQEIQEQLDSVCFRLRAFVTEKGLRVSGFSLLVETIRKELRVITEKLGNRKPSNHILLSQLWFAKQMFYVMDQLLRISGHTNEDSEPINLIIEYLFSAHLLCLSMQRHNGSIKVLSAAEIKVLVRIGDFLNFLEIFYSSQEILSFSSRALFSNELQRAKATLSALLSQIPKQNV